MISACFSLFLIYVDYPKHPLALIFCEAENAEQAQDIAARYLHIVGSAGLQAFAQEEANASDWASLMLEHTTYMEQHNTDSSPHWIDKKSDDQTMGAIQ